MEERSYEKNEHVSLLFGAVPTECGVCGGLLPYSETFGTSVTLYEGTLGSKEKGGFSQPPFNAACSICLVFAKHSSASSAV